MIVVSHIVYYFLQGVLRTLSLEDGRHRGLLRAVLVFVVQFLVIVAERRPARAFNVSGPVVLRPWRRVCSHCQLGAACDCRGRAGAHADGTVVAAPALLGALLEGGRGHGVPQLLWRELHGDRLLVPRDMFVARAITPELAVQCPQPRPPDYGRAFVGRLVTDSDHGLSCSRCGTFDPHIELQVIALPARLVHEVAVGGMRRRALRHVLGDVFMHPFKVQLRLPAQATTGIACSESHRT